MAEDPKKRLREGVEYLEAQQNNQVAQTQIAQTQTAQTIVARDVVAQTAAQKNNVAQTIIAKDVVAQTPAQNNNVAVTQMAQTIVAQDIVSRNRDAITAKRLSRVDAMTTPSLRPLPTWDAGYDSSGRRLVQTLGQDPVAVGRPISTGAIGTGDRTYNTGNAVDVIPHIKPVNVVPVKIQESGKVKILFSVIEGSERVYYVGGDRSKPKELLRSPIVAWPSTAVLVNTGSGQNNFFWQKLDQPTTNTSNFIDSRYPSQVFDLGRASWYNVNFSRILGDGVWFVSDLESVVPSTTETRFYRNGEIFPKMEGPDIFHFRVWLGEINDSSFFDEYSSDPRARIQSKVPLHTQWGYTFATHARADGGRRLYSQKADGTVLNFSDFLNEIDFPLSDLYNIYVGSRIPASNTITKAGIFYTRKIDELAIPSDAKSLDFLTLDLNTGVFGAKTEKIFPLKNNGTALQIHSVSRNP